jgi:hypothetical protein
VSQRVDVIWRCLTEDRKKESLKSYRCRHGNFFECEKIVLLIFIYTFWI